MRSLKAAESMTPDTNILEVEISLPDASLVTCQSKYINNRTPYMEFMK